MTSTWPHAHRGKEKSTFSPLFSFLMNNLEGLLMSAICLFPETSVSVIEIYISLCFTEQDISKNLMLCFVNTHTQTLVFPIIELFRKVSKGGKNIKAFMKYSAAYFFLPCSFVWRYEAFFCRRLWKYVYLNNTGFVVLQFFHRFLSQGFICCSHLERRMKQICVPSAHCSLFT